MQTPQPVLDFMAAFDAGEFPALTIPDATDSVIAQLDAEPVTT